MVRLVARQVGQVARARSIATVPALSVWTVCVHLVPLLAAFRGLGRHWGSVGWVDYRAVRVECLDRVVHVSLRAHSTHSTATCCEPREDKEAEGGRAGAENARFHPTPRSRDTHLRRLAAVAHLELSVLLPSVGCTKSEPTGQPWHIGTARPASGLASIRGMWAGS